MRGKLMNPLIRKEADEGGEGRKEG